MSPIIPEARGRRATAAAAVLVALLGCGDDTPPIGKVTGTVTRGGKPLPGLTINFFPEGGRPSWGLTDESGRYQLSWDADHPGAEVGKHKILIAFMPGSPLDQAGYGASTKKKKDEKPATANRPEDWDEIQRKYGNLDTTALTREVKPGSQVIDLQLD